MKKILLFATFILLFVNCFAQQKAVRRASSYSIEIKKFQKKYVATHDVVSEKNKKYFKFYSPSSKYNVLATFTKIIDTTIIAIKTSGKKIPEK